MAELSHEVVGVLGRLSDVMIIAEIIATGITRVASGSNVRTSLSVASRVLSLSTIERARFADHPQQVFIRGVGSNRRLVSHDVVPSDHC